MIKNIVNPMTKYLEITPKGKGQMLMTQHELGQYETTKGAVGMGAEFAKMNYQNEKFPKSLRSYCRYYLDIYVLYMYIKFQVGCTKNPILHRYVFYSVLEVMVFIWLL